MPRTKKQIIKQCGECGRKTEEWQNNRCPTCDALHINDKLATFNLSITLDVAIKSLFKDKQFQGDFIDKITKNSVDIVATERQLLAALGWKNDPPFGIIENLINDGEMQVGFLIYKWKLNA